MGPTHAERAKRESPDCIRALFGNSDTRNAVHGSDSVETSQKEIKFFFPHFDITPYLNTIDQKKVK